MDIKTEWIYCPDCGQPVYKIWGTTTLVEVSGSYEQTDIEHECES